MKSVKVTLINTILSAVLSLIVSLLVAIFTIKNQNKVYRPLLQLRYRKNKEKFVIDDGNEIVKHDNTAKYEDITSDIPFIDINNTSTYGAFNIKINIRLKNKDLSCEQPYYIKKYYINVLNSKTKIRLGDDFIEYLKKQLTKVFKKIRYFSITNFKNYVNQLLEKDYISKSSYNKLIKDIDSGKYDYEQDVLIGKILRCINDRIISYWRNYILEDIDIWLTTMQGEQVKITYENYQGILMIKKKGYKRCKYNYSDLKNTTIIYQ